MEAHDARAVSVKPNRTGAGREGLAGFSVFAAVLAAAGLPIYIHAPKFYVDEYGVGLGALGAALFGLRLLDVVQDPALGWLSGRLGRWRGLGVAFAVVVMAGAMIGLFAVAPPTAPLIWFAAMLALLSSAFSFLNITFYGVGVEKVGRARAVSHVRLAAWRETGALFGVCLAAIAPTALAGVSPSPFALFAFGFAVAALLAAGLIRGEWVCARPPAGFEVAAILQDRDARRLLLIAFVNAAPVAVTSTLFLFFVEYRLQAPGAEGPLLVLFFLAAAISAPGWGALAGRYGARRVLLAGMVLSVLAFGFATTLGAGDLVAFALVSAASGAALGADMTLLPALFARRVETIARDPAQAFGLWSFVSKLTLAVAAATVLPLLDLAGLEAGAVVPQSALTALTLLYAVLPIVLKLVAIALLATMDRAAEGAA
ncbi:MFS transporter [Maritimibacter sp. HL-12]|uniref:MFS transporter n=1 Tax=Maritimibacter sp. HL-12 TaxID=1162418 RepID=UPI000A0F062E|nr:MFS transporter [Maritimibacter sp. HL-12]SMH40487.1 glycoside/pentoside/hexuronide:cation symporter, GPH family [Maritimibacter sp. HL-12]